MIKTYDVRMGEPDPEARSLSGGNLQKFVVGRELDRQPKVLVVDQPPWGVDAGAAATIRRRLSTGGLGLGGCGDRQALDEIFEFGGPHRSDFPRPAFRSASGP